MYVSRELNVKYVNRKLKFGQTDCDSFNSLIISNYNTYSFKFSFQIYIPKYTELPNGDANYTLRKARIFLINTIEVNIVENNVKKLDILSHLIIYFPLLS